ncbi:MAG: NUDIX domain-containing protein [Candidatus Nealsonbacteria bacterium]|nr:NUDIX domain-containing protein [Candidatus Nealsonbacteria bacterium]
MELEKSAGAVVFRKKEGRRLYLLLHYDAGHWSFPKGNIEKGEKLKETVIRETQEETGIEDLDFVKGFKEHIKYTYKREGKDIFKIVTYFLASTKTKEVKISWEHQGFQWLIYEEALQQLTYKNARTVLEKVHSFLDTHG